MNYRALPPYILGDSLKYPLPVLMVLFFILNLLDYSTTAYALNCIPNAYEENELLANPEDAFRLKILYGTPIWIAYFLCGVFLEWMRVEHDSAFIRFCYFLMLSAAILLVVQYILIVVHNFTVILTYC